MRASTKTDGALHGEGVGKSVTSEIECEINN